MKVSIVDQIILKEYGDKNISYINHPEHLAKDRDKELTKKLVSNAGVLAPKSFYFWKSRKGIDFNEHNIFFISA